MSNSPFETMVLQHLDGVHSSSGCIAADFADLVGRQPGKESNRQHSAYVAGLLLQMEAKGLIQRADAGRPILWQLARRAA